MSESPNRRGASSFGLGPKEVEAAQSTNTYLGIIYGSGIASLLFLLSLYLTRTSLGASA